ncbi:glyceraldehyde 3-phosphate dehydrogenase NAD-binding domain-containing protein [Paenibacillus sp.]|uniref:type I glyceraldehyde-3-phosphate dehydrogenase n=1 Tax=Paenibacillus sp. TaxID=58172 RepID=UPI0028115C97|nr:glyceraldehyde 3-phosphate dehydrogenase NAD-binding domain-containing protein [Paenibacillus sp.]
MGGGIGINGLGRIGRLTLRRLLERERTTGLRVEAVNSLYPAETIAHLLRYDSIHGKLDASLKAEGGRLLANGRAIEVLCERDPTRIPWSSSGVSTVIESTGQFNDAEGAGKHLSAGAEYVVVTAPGKGMDITIVKGVNEEDFDRARHRLVSTASCTTNCVAPVLHALDRAYGVVDGWITAVHAYTNDQRHLDNPHSDLRRARACTQSIVPTTTGIGKALTNVLPHLADSVHGLSIRVPTPNVSIADMTVTLKRSTDVDQLRRVLLARQSACGDVLGFVDEPLVSVDFVGDSRSAVIDGLALAVYGNQAKILAWYDNEWGYSCRVVDMTESIALPSTVISG